MRTSQFLLATLKETPADAEIASHQLMLRAGMIRRLSSGLYSWLPLGLRVLRNVERIVREELNASGALEILMPNIQPAELWQESGRWDIYGDMLLRIKDRADRDFCFGPTHEEVITDIARRELKSYKDCPLNMYQIQTKFRDEIRPRFGVMRAREFIMKDAYSFDADIEGMEKSYQIMHDAYHRIFNRLGLKFKAVLADSGEIGGSTSHEFQVLANTGEDKIAVSTTSDYAANIEFAETMPSERPAPTKEIETVDTQDTPTIEDVCTALNAPTKTSIKALLVKGSKELPAKNSKESQSDKMSSSKEDETSSNKDNISPVVVIFLRGDHQLNEVKAQKHPLIASPLTFATEEDIAQTDLVPGYVGPVGLNAPMIVDHGAASLADFVCGANSPHKHNINTNWERDVALPETADLRDIEAGDPSPDGKGEITFVRGIEVGHIFQLGTKYSKALGAKVLGQNGKPVDLEMGCYGIGVSRIVAAAIEQNHDDNGIIWPDAMAPFQIALAPINYLKSEATRKATDELYEKLTAAGYDVLLDDRKERTGVIFANMDLIGIPHRLVISDRGLEAGTIEYKARGEDDSQAIKADQIMEHLSIAVKI